MDVAWTLSAVALWSTSATFAAVSPERELYHDAKAIYDVSSLRLEEVPTGGPETWLLIRVVPDRHSGTGTMGYYEDAKGSIRYGLVAALKGSWTVVAGINKAHQIKGGTYAWNEWHSPHEQRKAADLHSPFKEPGGLLLCCYNPRAKNAARFQPRFLLPSPWEKAVLPAYEFCRENPQVLAPTAPLKRNVVVELLNGNNPLLFVAFRRLLECGGASPAMATAALGSTDAWQRSVVTYMILALSEEPRRAGLLAVLKRAFEGCEEAGAARSVAIGAFAAGYLHGGIETIASPSRELLKGLRSRLARDGQGIVADPVLQRVLTSVQVSNP